MTLFDVHNYDRAVPVGPLVRVRMTVAYDGTPFHGFAEQPGLLTVAGRLSHALERLLGHRVDLVGAGRTDRGVHAAGQVVSFDASATALSRRGLEVTVARLNKLCGPEIVVRDAVEAAPGFDARYSARSRSYRYTIRNAPTPDPFDRQVAWWVPQPLRWASLAAGADALIGEHDFSSFCRRPRGRPDASLMRRVIDARWVTDPTVPETLRFEIEATSFCHQMVRSLVGTLIAMGRGERRPGEMLAILRAADRNSAGPVAPPHGLCLWHVRYH